MSEFSHLKNKLLAEQVEDQIYHYILDEALEPCAKLPNEFALGEKFRVGRSTISEAVKLLSSKDAKKVYTQTTAAVLRMKDCTMQTVNKVQEEAGDILADAKAINESRAAEAAQEVIEDTAEEEQPAEQTAQ